MRLEFVRPDLLYLVLLVPVWWLLVWPRRGGGVLYARGDFARRITGWWGRRAWFVLTLPRFIRAAGEGQRKRGQNERGSLHRVSIVADCRPGIFYRYTETLFAVAFRAWHGIQIDYARIFRHSLSRLRATLRYSSTVRPAVRFPYPLSRR